MPGVNRFARRKIVEDQIDIRQHLGEQNDLAGVHRFGKRFHNRFPFFCLQTRKKIVDGFLTASALRMLISQ